MQALNLLALDAGLKTEINVGARLTTGKRAERIAIWRGGTRGRGSPKAEQLEIVHEASTGEPIIARQDRPHLVK